MNKIIALLGLSLINMIAKVLFIFVPKISASFRALIYYKLFYKCLVY